MGWLGESKYNCPECDGEGETECGECSAEHECEHCSGSGWNPELIDVPAFLAVSKKLSLGGITCEWIEGGRRIGRRICAGARHAIRGIRAEDFVRKEAK